MSVEATSWAFRQTCGGDTCAHMVLLVLADSAHHDGKYSFLAVSTLMDRIGVSERTIRRKLAWLERVGLILRGDQSAVRRYPANRRPVVWDLPIHMPVLDPDALGCQNDTPDKNPVVPTVSRGDRMTPQGRGDTRDRSRGDTGVRSRGVTRVTQTINKTINKNHPLKPPAGAVGAADGKYPVPASPASQAPKPDPRFDGLRSEWPKKSGSPTTLRRLWDAAVAASGAGTVLASAEAYLRANRGTETRYLKGLKSFLADPACYAAVPEGGGGAVSPLAAGREWQDAHALDPGCPSLYEVAGFVRSHPGIPAGRVPALLDEHFLREEVA